MTSLLLLAKLVISLLNRLAVKYSCSGYVKLNLISIWTNSNVDWNRHRSNDDVTSLECGANLHISPVYANELRFLFLIFLKKTFRGLSGANGTLRGSTICKWAARFCDVTPVERGGGGAKRPCVTSRLYLQTAPTGPSIGSETGVTSKKSTRR